MKTRKGRFILYGVQIFMLILITVVYFSNNYNFSTPEQNAKMINLLLYTFLIYVVILLGEWIRAFDKDSPRYKKYLFRSLAIIWALLLPIFLI